MTRSGMAIVSRRAKPSCSFEGQYVAFAHLETLYLGVLARRTRVATNTRLVVEAAWPKPVMFFPARFDHWLVQTGDGYAAHIAGAIGVSTDAQASWWGSTGIGTVPHALIAAFGGDTVAASVAMAQQTGPGRPDDYPGRFRQRLRRDVARGGPRTRAALVRRASRHVRDDGRSLDPAADGGLRSARREPAAGAQRSLGLDAEGFAHVRITVSGGFDPAKIRRFESEGVPVDSYGVGSSLFGGRFDFTGDIVEVDGRAGCEAGKAAAAESEARASGVSCPVTGHEHRERVPPGLRGVSGGGRSVNREGLRVPIHTTWPRKRSALCLADAATRRRRPPHRIAARTGAHVRLAMGDAA